MKAIYFLLAIGLSTGVGFAQEEEDVFQSINTPPTINLNEEEESEEVKPKKKKRKKNVYYGIKTRKQFTKSGYGDKEVLELFSVLKEHQDKNPYIRDYYWFDYQKRSIRKGGKFDPSKGALLHGPYTKRRGDVVIEQGIYFLGAKHGRWTKHDKYNILVDKEKYYKGWPKESLVSYYDQDKEKIKELIPVEYGENEGNYYYFADNGMVAVRGEYKFGSKVGKWVEYYKNSTRSKRIIQYPDDPFDEETKPYIWREYNRRGKLIYENKKKST